MSLINDALKKAARQRAEEQADVAAPRPGGNRPSRHGQPMRKQTMVLIGGAIVALVVVSSVITGIMMTSRSDTKPVADVKSTPQPSPAPVPARAAEQAAPMITVSAPQATPPAPTAAPIAISRPVPTALPVAPSPAPTAAAVAASSAPAASPQSHDELIQGIVDRFHVSGVRAAGNESKALLDGHVYKVNDLVERAVGLRLIKVEEGQLTFVDAAGEKFVKTF
jgi:hypothetical protein